MTFSLLKLEYLRMDRELHHIEFLQTCRDLGIIPKFLRSRSIFLSNSFASAKYLFEMSCLKSMIRRKFGVVDAISKKIYGLKNDGLYNKLSIEQDSEPFDLSMRKIQIFRAAQNRKLESKLISKINFLSPQHNYRHNKKKDFDFVNISSRCFNENEEKILFNGPKYIYPSQSNPKICIPQFEDIISNVDSSNKEEVRNFIFYQYKNYMKKVNKIPFNDFQFIKSLKNDPNIAVIKTDKSNKIAILDRVDYISKMDDCIREMGCTAVNKDPLPSFVKKVKDIIKFGFWPDYMKTKIKLDKLARIPVMFGCLKDHKTGFPLRPIISKCSSPSYHIEKAFVLYLKSILPPSNRTLSSSKDFVQKLQLLNLPDDFTMATLDVKALYPSIDVQKARDIIVNLINNDNNLQVHMKTTLISGINLIISNNFFKFNNNIFFQGRGAPMGSPISGLLAEFILRPLEDEFLNNTFLSPLTWLRFVDDVFVIWTHPSTSLQTFLNELNNMNPQIQFTIEVENNASISFMDVQLCRDGPTITTSVYRKTMNSLCTIPGTASAPKTYKLAAFRSYIYRALALCSPSTIHQEFDNIREIALKNGFQVSTINNLIYSIARKRDDLTATQTITKRVACNYIPGFHEKLSQYLRRFNIQLIAKTSPKLINLLCTKVDPIPMLETAGVYQIPYALSDGTIKFYIGMTSRRLSTRIAEHQADIKYSREKTALSRMYNNDNSIVINFNQARIIARYSSYFKTLVCESIEINSRKSEICNEQDSYNIPKLWLNML